MSMTNEDLVKRIDELEEKVRSLTYKLRIEQGLIVKAIRASEKASSSLLSAVIAIDDKVNLLQNK